MKDAGQQKTEGAWKRLKGRIQESWGDLTDDDLDKYEGKESQLEGYISQRTGEGRESVSEKLKRFADELKH